jgi:formylglycine-generating enzyme required for sulfatase activity
VIEGRRAAIGLAVAVAAIGLFAWARSQRGSDVACGAGFVVAGTRCCDTPESKDGVCARSTMPAQRMVLVPDTRLAVGPSDWEAEGRVAPRTIDVRAFRLDAYEATVDHGPDAARARAGVSFAEAKAYCESRGLRLPTEDEWIAAAAGPSARRYPWGDTGAVCRRAAWGLATGPCATGSVNGPAGPDSVGAHPDGRTPLGVEDLAGNVAEWTTSPKGPVVHGGSWASALATELRTWSTLEVDPGVHDARVGVRCASDAAGR